TALYQPPFVVATISTASPSVGPTSGRIVGGSGPPCCGTTRLVRLLVARCSVEYEGRLGARLAPATRLLVLKADGSIAVPADSKAYKPLNWMSPPCTVHEDGSTLVATNPGGERLVIELHEVLHDVVFELGDDPGLAKDGVEAELQELLARRVAALRDD